MTTQITVMIPVESLAGLADTPGQLSDHGIIPADLARRLAPGDARWRHILTHRITDAVLDVGRWSYRPPPRWPVMSDSAMAPVGSPAAWFPRRNSTSTT